MLWSLLKILVFFVVVAALAYGAVHLLDMAGGIQITVAGFELNLGPLQSVIALVALVVALWVVLKLLSLLVAVWKFLNGDETALSRFFDKGRERRGYQALADGMMALASGEGRLAMAKADRAARYLEKPELTDLLTAQAAEMAGDTKKAAATYKRLVTNDKTRFVGVRGIMKQKLAEGDTDTARKLAEKALALRPRHEETQDVLLNLQARAQDWAGARKTLTAKLKSGSLPRDVYKRRDAVLALSEARDVAREDVSIEARERAIEANRLSPDLVPAAALAARAYIAQNKPKLALRVLKKAWDAQPHPDLAAAFAAIAPDETPQERVKRFQTLTRLHPDHAETRLLQAELNIVAEDFPEARRALSPLLEGAPDSRAFTLMAAVERGEGAGDAVVQGWLARALNAPRGPQWVCQNCNHIHAEWAPFCDNCHAFDTLSWTTPSTPELIGATGTAMLPLIIGSIEDKRAEGETSNVVAPHAPQSAPVDEDAVEDAVELPDEPVEAEAAVEDGTETEEQEERK